MHQQSVMNIVPFLPLERQHVLVCIKQLVQVLRDEDKYEIPERDIIKRVVNLIEFTRSKLSSVEYSISGCKNVPQKFHFVLETIQPTLKKKKKSEVPDKSL